MDYLRSALHQAGFVPSAVLVAIFYVFLRGARDTMWRIALLSLPGTIAHELMHLVVGFVLRARPQGFTIWPRRSTDGWRLGAVSFRSIGLLNGAFVALAPLLLLPLAWLGLIYVLAPLWVEGRWGWWLLAGYLAATVLFAALPSFQDLRIGALSLLLYAAIGALLWWAYAYA
ncbi:MAG TPA: hypothetical protein VFR50_09005 [Casimicrobiaceae bacterium]|nr:hypothetical protein [Casimicrobiaceae bacterium]